MFLKKFDPRRKKTVEVLGSERAYVERVRERVRTWPNQNEVTVPGIHFIQEDSGPEIGKAIADWLRDL